MWHWLALVSLVLYLICSLWFLVSSLLQLHLLWKSRAGKAAAVTASTPARLPSVTIQVPVYNERYVIARLLETLGQLDYPRNLLEIQVLDDSTDDTSAIVYESCKKLMNDGLQVTILQRTQRTGYKAGALEAGLPQCRGSLIAIFDADFTPAPDFLNRMVHYFDDPDVGGVQGRWAHRNLRENWLTVIQSYLLDSHFSLEQQGRSAAGYYVNFNGTAGVWRKDCIIASGGWNGKVLTEDLELSYRAQLLGWKFMYDESVSVPADLPADMDAFKAQQFRWAKGMAQSALCHLTSVLKMPVPLAKKVHAVFHLMSSVSFIAILGNLLLALPVLIGRHHSETFHDYSQVIVLTGITLPIICCYYKAGTRNNLTAKEFWLHLPAFLVVYMALCAQNSIAVLQGWAGYATAFVRTPKPERNSRYGDDADDWSPTAIFEAIVFVYVLITIVVCIVWQDYFLLTFLVMALAGLALLLKPLATRSFRKLMISKNRVPNFR